MTRTQAEVLLLAVLLAGAWLAFGRGVPRPMPGDVPTRTRAAASDDPVGAGLAERTKALRDFRASPPPRGAVRRNPFSFVSPVRQAAAPAAVMPLAIVPDPPPRPPVTLLGIAEDAGPAGPVRTAVLKSDGQVVFAKEGDRVLSRFLVVRIAADAVQLKDTERGDAFTLILK
jgi:hypothetical protein